MNRAQCFNSPPFCPRRSKEDLPKVIRCSASLCEHSLCRDRISKDHRDLGADGLSSV